MADEREQTHWERLTGGTSGADYAARFAALEATGKDMHGEARFCAALLAPGAKVLDAGCGTGRVGIHLSRLGFDVVGVDVDDSMLAVAREHAPQLTWLRGDLAEPPELPGPFDLVVMAGNVVPLLAPGTLPTAARALASTLRPGGLLVAGFGLSPQHLPAGCPVTTLDEYDAATAGAGLEPLQRFATWDAEPFPDGEGAGYAVSVHRLPD